MASVRINLSTEAILAGIGSIITSIVISVWILLQVLVVDPLHDLQKELKEFRMMYIEEITTIKSKVASLEDDVDRMSKPRRN